MKVLKQVVLFIGVVLFLAYVFQTEVVPHINQSERIERFVREAIEANEQSFFRDIVSLSDLDAQKDPPPEQEAPTQSNSFVNAIVSLLEPLIENVLPDLVDDEEEEDEDEEESDSGGSGGGGGGSSGGGDGEEEDQDDEEDDDSEEDEDDGGDGGGSDDGSGDGGDTGGSDDGGSDDGGDTGGTDDGGDDSGDDGGVDGTGDDGGTDDSGGDDTGGDDTGGDDIGGTDDSGATGGDDGTGDDGGGGGDDDSVGVPFGAYNGPVDGSDPEQLSAAHIAISPSNATTLLDRARSNGISVVVRLQGNPYDSNKQFSQQAWMDLIDTFIGIPFDDYYADDTLLGHNVFEEPQDPQGNPPPEPISQQDLDWMVQYSQNTIMPGIPHGTRANFEYMEEYNWQNLDFMIMFYVLDALGLSVAEFRDLAEDTARSAGLGLLLGMQAEIGNNHSPITAAMMEEWGTTLLQSPDTCALLFYQYTSLVLNQPGMQDAINAVHDEARSHNPPPCD